MSAYYNENDPRSASWLRELIGAGLIAPGEVDERSIEDVLPSEVVGFRQCHWFAGVGGWSLALRLAGWPDDRPVWTGSCPCQPFSQAGKRKGDSDERHLWPAWQWLIGNCLPPVVFGEQVASKAADDWLQLVRDDMEGAGYWFDAVHLPACGVGSPHLRQRSWFVADRVGDAEREGLVSGSHRGVHPEKEIGRPRDVKPERSGESCKLADHSGSGLEEREEQSSWEELPSAERGGHAIWTGPADNAWRDCDWIACRDGKWRPVEPGTFPLAHGVPDRVGLLRGYGNAIVPQVAKEVIECYMQASLSGGV